MSRKAVSDASKAKMPDLTSKHVLNDVLKYNIPDSHFTKIGVLTSKGVGAKKAGRLEHDRQVLEEWVAYNHAHIGVAPATELNLLDMAIRLANSEDPLTQLIHVKGKIRGKDKGEDPLADYQQQGRCTDKSKQEAVDMTSLEAVKKTIDTNNNTVHRNCNSLAAIWMQHPYLIHIYDREVERKVAELIQAFYNDKLRHKVKRIGITPELLQSLGMSSAEISFVMSHRPAFRPLKDMFGITSDSILQAGYKIFVGNMDAIKLPLSQNSANEEDDTPESPTATPKSALKKRKHMMQSGEEDDCRKKVKAMVELDEDDEEPMIQIKQEPVEPDAEVSESPAQYLTNEPFLLTGYMDTEDRELEGALSGQRTATDAHEQDGGNARLRQSDEAIRDDTGRLPEQDPLQPDVDTALRHPEPDEEATSMYQPDASDSGLRQIAEPAEEESRELNGGQQQQLKGDRPRDWLQQLKIPEHFRTIKASVIEADTTKSVLKHGSAALQVVSEKRNWEAGSKMAAGWLKKKYSTINSWLGQEKARESR